MTPSGFKQRLVAEQVALLYRKLPVALVTVLINGGLSAFLIWHYVPRSRVALWVSLLAGISLSRLVLWAAFRRSRSSRLRAPQWGWAFAGGALANGVAWGAVALLFYDHLPSSLNLFLVFVLGGMVAGAVSSTSTHIPAFLAFAVPALCPMVVRLVGEPDLTSKIMGMMGVVYGVAMLVMARDGGRVMAKVQRLWLENADLAAALEKTSQIKVARLRALLEQAEVAFIVADANTLEIRDASRPAAELLRFEESQLEGASLPDVLGKVGVPEIGTLFPKEGEALSHATQRSVAVPDGRVLDVRSSEHQYAKGRYRLVILRDVTEKRRESEESARMSLMQSIVSTAAGISHEINNPLATVVMNLEVLERSVSDSAAPNAQPLIADAQLAASRIARTVRELSELSELPQGGEDRSTDLGASLTRCVRTVFTNARERGWVRLESAPMTRVKGSRIEIEQILLNVLTNAKQAISAPTQNGRADEPSVVVRTQLEDDRVRVEVQDSGVGVPTDLGARIFEPFVTSRPVGAGAGLGLTMSYRLISSLGGTITFHEAPEKGTVFTLFLPIAEPEPPACDTSSIAPSNQPETLASNTRILVVEDEVLVARSLKWELDGFEVTIAGSGAEALQRLERENFDVVLCDVMMPGMNGTELYAQVQERWPEVSHRFVFTTGGAVTERERAFVRETSAPCVLKPFQRNELLTAIRSVSPPPASGS